MNQETGRVESVQRAEEAVGQYLAASQYENAGLLLLKMGDHRRAAQAFWKCGDFKKAGHCALRAGFYAQAGEAYLRAGEHLLAAKAFTQAKEMGKAAEAYESAGKFQEATRMYLLVRNYLKAGELFQKMPEIHPHFLEASDKLAKALWERSAPELLKEKSAPPAGQKDPREETLPLRYQVAHLHLEHRSFMEARSILQEIVAYKPEYRDAAALLRRCDENLAPQGPPASNLPPLPLSLGLETDLAPAPVPPGSSQWSQYIGVLQEAHLLQEFSLADIREVFASGRVVQAARDTVIIAAGETGMTLYVLLEGLVRVTSGRDETEETLAIRLPGEHFGEMSLLEDAPTSANVVAAEPSVLFALDRKVLEQMIAATSPLALKFYRAFVKTLSQRLRKATNNLAAAKSGN
jgi:CRP/FNR family transcriptional regulator, cyclic AMP receptor protein